MKKHIPPLIWIVAAALLCVFFVRLGEETTGDDLVQIFLLYGALAVADGGLVAHTVIYRRENVSSVNFGYKLLAEGLVFLALMIAMVKEIFF